MDPFEVRMRFTSSLKHLNASQAAAQKAAQLALKHKDMHEDLHSCILEQLSENRNINTRANIMCFLEVLMDVANKDGQKVYLRMLQRDMHQIVSTVTPDDGISAINVPLTRKVIESMHQKGYLPKETFDKIIRLLESREGVAHDRVARRQADIEAAFATGKPSPAVPAAPAVEKRQVEQRVEEDRERHKRLRENIWAVTEAEEVAKLWEDGGDFDEDDYRLMREEAEERYKNIAVCPIHGRANMKPYPPAQHDNDDKHSRPPTSAGR